MERHCQIPAGPAGLGKIQLAYLLAVVVALLTSMGLPVSNAYLIGRGLFSTSAILWQNLLESIVASAISVCVILIMQSTLRRIVPIAPELLLVTLMWISLQTLVSNLSSVLLADRRFRAQSSANFLRGSVARFCFNRLEIHGGRGSGRGLRLSPGHFRRRHLSDDVVPGGNQEDFNSLGFLAQRIVAQGLKGYFGTILQLFTYRFDVFVVGRFSGAAALGYYAIAYSATECLWQIPQAIATVLMPTTASSAVEKRTLAHPVFAVSLSPLPPLADCCSVCF